MKKTVLVMFVAFIVICFTGCSRHEVAEIGDTAKKETLTVEVSEDDYIYAEQQDTDTEVELRQEDGSSVTVIGSVDYSTPGEYPVKVTYTKNNEEITEEKTVVVDTPQNIEAVRAEKEEEKKTEDTGSAADSVTDYTVEIDGVMYDPEMIVSADIITTEKWVEALFSGVTEYYEKTSPYSEKDYIWIVQYSGMSCETLKMLENIRMNGGHINIDGEKSFFTSCGLVY